MPPPTIAAQSAVQSIARPGFISSSQTITAAISAMSTVILIWQPISTTAPQAADSASCTPRLCASLMRSAKSSATMMNGTENVSVYSTAAATYIGRQQASISSVISSPFAPERRRAMRSVARVLKTYRTACTSTSG